MARRTHERSAKLLDTETVVELLAPENTSAVDFSSVALEPANLSCLFVAVLHEDQQKTRDVERKGLPGGGGV